MPPLTDRAQPAITATLRCAGRSNLPLLACFASSLSHLHDLTGIDMGNRELGLPQPLPFRTGTLLKQRLQQGSFSSCHLLCRRQRTPSLRHLSMREDDVKKASHVTGKTTVAKASWLRLVKIDWEDESGKSMTWEAVERNTAGEDTASGSPAEPSVYGVAILPILQSKGKDDEVMLITQFRPPIGKMCVETPAGLVGKGEDMQATAWRELKEETGLTISHVLDDDAAYLYNDPGITDAGCRLLVVAVDAEEASNKAALERGAEGEVYGLAAEGEAIRQLRVPLQGLRSRLNALMEQGYAVDGKLHCFARGLEVAQKLMK